LADEVALADKGLEDQLSQLLEVPVRVIARDAPEHPYSYPQERVVCQAGEDEIRLLIKYDDGEPYTAHGLRGGLAYEASVYRELRDRLELPAPAFYGFRDLGAGEMFIAVEYLDDYEPINWADPDEALPQAAAVIGQVHARGQQHVARCSPVLKRYTRSYFAGWARRAAAFVSDSTPGCQWWAHLCQHAQQALPGLLSSPATVIHGELFPSNVLHGPGGIRIVDWETAAVAAGEIDLAFLTHGDWEEELVDECLRRYRRARYGVADPDERSDRRLLAARLYLALRWLGDEPEWIDEAHGGLLEEAAAYSRALGWVAPDEPSPCAD
jgi:hypothetical protein